MQKTVKAAIETLIAGGYAVIENERVVLTDKTLELDTAALDAKPPPYTKSVTLLDPGTKSVIPKAGEQAALIKFIIECKVPQKIKAADGKNYWANKYSKEAEKELKKILLDGYQYDILVAATTLYYASGGFCEAISNYLVRGTWLTHYMEMQEQLNAGTVNKHIRDNLNDQVGGGAMYDDR